MASGSRRWPRSRIPLLVPQAIFVALGAEDRSSDWSLGHAHDFLAGKRLLLVIDNCEHLLDACAVLASTLLKACPELHLLATSRQALGVVGEVRMPVPPMSLPVEGNEPSAESLANSEAVRLLSERAAAVVPGFAIDDKNAEPILRLCRRLDGIPLAHRAGRRPFGCVEPRPAQPGPGRFACPPWGAGTGGPRLVSRHSRPPSAGATDCSTTAEQLLWARLSVFAGGFDAAAAIEVCADDRVPPERIVELLGSLVEKSIVRRELKSGNAPRYSFLETIRQYGRERLRDIRRELPHPGPSPGLDHGAGQVGRGALTTDRPSCSSAWTWSATTSGRRSSSARENRDAAPIGAELAQHLLGLLVLTRTVR